MCVKIMSEVFDLVDMIPLKKWVLMAFADAANDDGVTWIAIQSQKGKRDIMKKTSMSLRAIQKYVRELEREGHLERQETIGKGCLWIVRAVPAGLAGIWASSSVSTPAPRAGVTPANQVSTPAPRAGEPLLNPHLEKESARNIKFEGEKCPIANRALPAGLTLEQWEAFLDMRFALGKAVKPYVAHLLLQKLDALAGKWVAGDLVNRSTVHGWPDIYEPEEGRVTGVRRVVSGKIADPVGGWSDDDRAEHRRIADIWDMGEKLAALREFHDRMDRRNTPTTIGRLAGELNLGPPMPRKSK